MILKLIKSLRKITLIGCISLLIGGGLLIYDLTAYTMIVAVTKKIGDYQLYKVAYFTHLGLFISGAIFFTAGIVVLAIRILKKQRPAISSKRIKNAKMESNKLLDKV